jgi:hypothetical protein
MGADAGPPDSEVLLADQRARWERGDRVPVEHFVERQPALRNDSDTLLDLIERPAATRHLSDRWSSPGQQTTDRCVQGWACCGLELGRGAGSVGDVMPHPL